MLLFRSIRSRNPPSCIVNIVVANCPEKERKVLGIRHASLARVTLARRPDGSNVWEARIFGQYLFQELCHSSDAVPARSHLRQFSAVVVGPGRYSKQCSTAALHPSLGTRSDRARRLNDQMSQRCLGLTGDGSLRTDRSLQLSYARGASGGGLRLRRPRGTCTQGLIGCLQMRAVFVLTTTALPIGRIRPDNVVVSSVILAWRYPADRTQVLVCCSVRLSRRFEPHTALESNSVS